MPAQMLDGLDSMDSLTGCQAGGARISAHKSSSQTVSKRIFPTGRVAAGMAGSCLTDESRGLLQAFAGFTPLLACSQDKCHKHSLSADLPAFPEAHIAAPVLRRPGPLPAIASTGFGKLLSTRLPGKGTLHGLAETENEALKEKSLLSMGVGAS